MSIFDSIVKTLENAHTSFQLLEHEPIFTIEQSIRVCHHTPQQSVKTLLVKLYKTKKEFAYWLVVWQGTDSVNINNLLTDLGVKRWKLAQPNEVLKELGVTIGAVAPFGYVKKYPVIFDNRLLNNETVYINPGVHNKTIALRPVDLLTLVDSSALRLVSLTPGF